MPLIPAKCTQCGSNIKVDDTKEAGICEFCGTAFITEKAIHNYNISNTISEENATINLAGGAVENFLKRAFMFLEDGEWGRATEYCEKVLDIAPENAEAYLGKLMAELHIKKDEDLKNLKKPFDTNVNYQKTARFASDELKNTLAGYIEYINSRNEKLRLKREQKTKKCVKLISIITAIVACITTVAILVKNPIKYNYANNLMNKGDFDKAYNIFVALGDYKDSEKNRLTITKKSLKNVNIGDYVKLGAYEQDNNTSNGKERIEWLVLDVKDGKALVVSKYALDCKEFHYENNISICWEASSIRKWLNSDFMDSAFSGREKAIIPTVTVSAHKNPWFDTDPGSSTQDKIFLLSIAEIDEYFSSIEARICRPTDFAIANGAYVNKDTGNYWWWLRTPGQDTGGYSYDYIAYVDHDGADRWYGLRCTDKGAIRPAMWIDLNP